MVAKAQIAEIQDRYRVAAREWLQLEVSYEGRGEARFSTNPGTLRGPMSIRYAEDGTINAFTMTVDELVAEHDPGGGLKDAVFAFVNGRPIPGKPGSFTIGGPSNKCDLLELTGEDFTVRVAQQEVIATGGQATVDFRPYRTIARFRSDVEPRYWAVPLLNYESNFSLVATELQGHPLRTRATSAYEQASGDVARYHEMAYRRGNSLIPFGCEGELGFIEPLPDYRERIARVEDGQTVATAAMVGRVPQGLDATVDDEWFPSDVVALLGLATGRCIGVPFVELRGASGELVGRMHAQIGSPSAQRRTSLIEESIDRSTGTLLSAFLTSQHREEIWLRVALRHLLRSFTGDLTVEDRLGHLCRAAEGLSAGLGLNRTRPLELSDETRERVDSSLQHWLDSLDLIASDATDADRERIARWRNRIKDAASNRPSFPAQLIGLLEYASLPDAAWLRDFTFRLKINGPTVPWPSAAQRYRNRIFHSAFIDFDRYDIDNAVPFIYHLSDVLVRVVFRLIGFDGQYKPPCGAHGMTVHEKPDWATPERLSPELLRYVE